MIAVVREMFADVCLWMQMGIEDGDTVEVHTEQIGGGEGGL